MELNQISSLLRNKHFNQYVAILHVAMSPKWRMKHPEVPSVRGTLDRLSRLVKTAAMSESAKLQFVNEFLGMYLNIVSADHRLCHRQEYMDWFVGVMDGNPEDMRLTMQLLFGAAVSQPQNFTAEQAAEITGKDSTTLRGNAAAGWFPGTYLAGKTWIFPDFALRAYGFDVPSTMKIEVEEESEN